MKQQCKFVLLYLYFNSFQETWITESEIVKPIDKVSLVNKKQF